MRINNEYDENAKFYEFENNQTDENCEYNRHDEQGEKHNYKIVQKHEYADIQKIMNEAKNKNTKTKNKNNENEDNNKNCRK